MAVDVDPTVHAKILELLKKGLADENSLTESDKDFLRARAPYIKQKHQDELPSVFSKEVVKEAKKKAGRPKKEPELIINSDPMTPQTPELNDASVEEDDDGEDEAEG